jgi:hypothetical protein
MYSMPSHMKEVRTSKQEIRQFPSEDKEWEGRKKEREGDRDNQRETDLHTEGERETGGFWGGKPTWRAMNFPRLPAYDARADASAAWARTVVMLESISSATLLASASSVWTFLDSSLGPSQQRSNQRPLGHVLHFPHMPCTLQYMTNPFC